MTHFTKIHILIITSFFSSSLIFAQEIDKEFLEGLSPEVRQQLQQDDGDKADEGLEQLFRSDTSIEKNKVILQQLKTQIDDLESMMEEDGELKDGLERFGSKFFNSIQSSFMPINIPNFDTSYIVGVGDIFDLMITGKKSSQSEVTVQRDGTLVIPDYGKVSVSGKSLFEVQEIVSNFLNIADLGIKPYLTLSKARDIQVILLGGVENPGIYTLSAGSNIIAALNVAGGISDNGSYRNIELKRGGKILNTIDLYDTFAFGNQDFILPLRSGDVVFTKPLSYLVPISGGVNNPAIYEMLPNESLSDIIKFAGDFSYSFSGFDSVELRRFSIEDSSVLDVKLKDLQNITLKPRDEIMVPSYTNVMQGIEYITIEGMVNRPGKYFITDGEKLSSLIERAGGYKKDAYIYGAALFRDSAISLEEEFNSRIFGDTLTFIISNIGQPGGGIDGATMDILKEENSIKKYTGRVITHFDNDIIESDPSKDITLKDRDRIVIPRLEKVVYSFGDFRNPSNMLYQSELKLSDYVKTSGGFNNSSSRDIIIIDPNGYTNIYRDRLLTFSSDIQIYPGSIIYAPRDIGSMSPIAYASVVSPILSNLAISLASLNSINN
ncbi:SLBB domain-containing protein [Gammaproteobacteria bacterium]|nr:SLBB domain-containing protein [Gammaproteobacteria bacterium]